MQDRLCTYRFRSHNLALYYGGKFLCSKFICDMDACSKYIGLDTLVPAT
jgi:hypothetical protein